MTQRDPIYGSEDRDGMNANMSREVAKEMINSFKWYQRIPLGGGLYTPGEGGDSEAKLRMMRLPEDLSGKSVLDIGTCEGFFAFEAERRGADRVLAIDINDKAQRKFEALKQILNSRVEFRVLNVTDLDERAIGTFDIVFFLSVFHHIRYPFLALDKIASVTQWMAVMEIPISAPTSLVANYNDEPMMIRRIGKTGRMRLLPNIAFLLESLERAGFGRVEILGTHRRRSVRGYENRDVQERVILKAFKRCKG